MRIAVLGCGSIGRRHLRNLLELGQTSLVALDPSPSVRDAIESEFGITCISDLNELWDADPELALICTPTDLHIDLAIEAAEHGCDLFIEKPLSHSLEGVADLTRLVRSRGLIVMVGCNMRFHPGPATVKRLLGEGAIGELIAARIQTGSFLPDWRPDRDYKRVYSSSPGRGGGAILDCIHEIDLALWYAGPPKTVAAMTRAATSIDLDVEGLAEILIEHRSGTLSDVHLNFVQRDYRRECQLIGDQGTIHWDVERPVVTVNDGSDEVRHAHPTDWTVNQMYLDEMDYFLEQVEQREQPFAGLREAESALRVALAAKESDEEGVFVGVRDVA